MIRTGASLIVLMACRAFGQPAAPQATFDVATIKPNANNDNNFMLRPPQGGNFTATGVTLKMLMMQAYDTQQGFRISGGPGWIGTERWDIQAKAESVQGQLPRDQFQVMLRALIEDRFQIKIHRETKQMPVYALVVGKNGSKLTPHAAEPGQAGAGIRLRPGSLSVHQRPIAAFATQLSLELGRMVIDKTNLEGEYDFELKWTSEPDQGGGLEARGLPPQPVSPPADSNGPSIFTALQEQLGLRLESRKGPVEILVIDHVERPSEN